ncbi:MAG TPA: metal ABC transporter substrate-binding protein [Thermoleophilaceae bacterium]
MRIILNSSRAWDRPPRSPARRLLPRVLPLVLLVAALVALATGCGSNDSQASGAQLTVVATTTQVADFVRNVGGDRVDVHGILGTNADPHDYEPRPSDVGAIGDAPLVFKSGGDIDAWLDELIENAGGDPRVVTLIDSVHRIEDEHGETDPHWWEDPRNTIRAVAVIRDALIEADPAGRATYERNAGTYLRKLEALDRDIADCMRRVPVDERKLVTTHDALGYFADRYDVGVVGALIPSLSTQAQPSARDINELVDHIRAEGVEAIFPETALNKRLESAVSREAGAKVGGQLWADALGPEGSGAETYLDAMRKNTSTMAEGMSGGAVSCSAH